MSHPIPDWKVQRIQKLLLDGVPRRAIAERFETTPQVINGIIYRYALMAPLLQNYLAFGT